MPVVSRSLDNAIHALNTLAKIARIGDRELGEMLEASRQTAYAKRHGEVRLSLDDIDSLADGLSVPPIVFLFDHQELMRWIGDNNWRGPNTASGLRISGSNCIQTLGSFEPRLFDPDGLPDVIDLRDHIVAQKGEEGSPALYAAAS